MQVSGRKILVDPVLSGAASPIPATTRAFPGSDRYTPADLPDIDYLFLTHDHWDHCDYRALVELRPRITTVITGLGTGAHLRRWGFDPARIIELDWNDSMALEGFTVDATTARHFSGRSLARNKTLWVSFVLTTPALKIFIGGDSGYDTHFADIGRKFGPFDLAILENGQYDKSWKYIHMTPAEVLTASRDLGAKRLLPVHSGKFALANHDWDEPLKLICELNTDQHIITPMIGECVDLLNTRQEFRKWWEGI